MTRTGFEKGGWIGRAIRFLPKMVPSLMRKGQPGTAPTALEGCRRRGSRGPDLRRLVLLIVVSVIASLEVAASASAAETFTNPALIKIPGSGTSGSASPYPSEIAVSGLAGPITDVSVTLHRFGHGWPDDVDMLLVSPSGTSVVLVSDACGITGVEDFTWTFSQSAPGPISGISGDCAAFTHQPANYGGGDTWPSPAPAGPHSTSLDAFDNENPSGTWRLFVQDDFGHDASGDIELGWSLSIQTGPVDMVVPGTGTSGPASFYPATQTVSGKSGLITDVNVAIGGIWHQNPDDLDLLLVGPRGQKVVLMAGACGSYGVKAYGWVWDDEAPALMPDGDGTDVCSARFHRPADYEPGDPWPAPAPPEPYSPFLSAFDSTNPNGEWSLYVNDDSPGNTGFFTNRFSLDVTTDTTPPTVVSAGPTNNATGVGLVANVAARFSEDMRATSINRNTLQLFRVGTTTRIGAAVSYDAAAKRATLNPTANLKPNTKYRAVVTTGARDLSGNALDQNPGAAGNQQKIWFFTTRR